MDKLLKVLRENPPTVGEAATAFAVALLYWLSTLLPDQVPGYVTWSGLVLAAVVAVGVIGRVTQRFTIPTDWLDAEAALELVDTDRLHRVDDGDDERGA